MATGRLFAALCLPLAAVLASPLDAAEGASRPSVRVEASARVAFDSNVFLQNGGPLVPGATATAPAREGAWVTSAAAGVAWRGTVAVAGKFGADYRAEVFRFRERPAENHDDHRVRISLSGAQDAAAWEISANVLWTNGARLSPLYNVLGGGPAIGGEPVRARRAQTVLRGGARVTCAQPGGWWRMLAAGLDQDFHTEFANGYAPYVDRGEYAAGAEFARDLKPGAAWVLGARAGRQRQADRPPAAGLNSTSDFVRVLGGIEGKLSAQWKLDLRAGPDFRRFTAAEPIAPGRRRAAPYVETTATWTPRAADAITLAGLHRLWPAGAGRGVYEDSTWELGWKRRWRENWTTRLGVRLADADNRADAYPGTKPWHDRILATTGAIEYRWSAHVLIDASIAGEEGRGLLPDTPGRAYTRTLWSIGVAGNW